MGTAPQYAIMAFLRRRYASAIACGDDRTATRLRLELDRLMNNPGARPGTAELAEPPELPPAA